MREIFLRVSCIASVGKSKDGIIEIQNELEELVLTVDLYTVIPLPEDYLLHTTEYLKSCLEI